jgi:hypothetical protein
LISGVTVSSGGYLYLSSGSTLTGKISVASGGTVSAYRGSILRLDISGHTEDTASLINNISLVRGAPEFYVTVKADQKFGSYKLAGGAADFKGSITVAVQPESVTIPFRSAVHSVRLTAAIRSEQIMEC